MRYEDKTKDQILRELEDLQQVHKKLQNQIDECSQVIEEYKDLFHNAMDIVYIHDLQGKIKNVNRAAEKMFNYITGLDKLTSILELITPEVYKNIMNEVREKIATGAAVNREIELQAKDNTLVCLEVNFRLLYKNNRAYAIHAIARDVSKHKKFERAIRESELKFNKIFYSGPDPIAITETTRGYFVEVNDAWVEYSGYSREEAIGHNPVELGIWPIYTLDHIVKLLLAQGYIHNFEAVCKIKSGELKTALFSADIIEIDADKYVICITKDISERIKMEAALLESATNLKYLSFHDKLTGLYNRAFFEEELKRLDDERHLPLSIIMGDLNGLKIINDAFGHHEGDKLLVSAARILTNCCRRDEIVARWGGDEFIILLPGCKYETASRILERLNKCSINIEEASIQASISLGMASKTSANIDIKDVIKEAEDNMYRNKLLESRSARSSFITSLEKTLWTRSHETQEHCQRMLEMAQKFGQIVNLNGIERNNLKLIARLHDIGKIAIPNSILNKPGELSEEEWELIKKHPEIGYRIALSSPELAPIAETILYHHERWDGTGYPLGLKGESIPLISRIIALADAYDVMINGRPYKKAMEKTEVWKEIEKCSGTQFDPDLVRKVKE